MSAASPSEAPPAGPTRPLRHLGRAGLLGVGINSVIGGGIFILPSDVSRLMGAWGLAAYAAAGLVVIGVGLSLARLAARFEESGGPYLYVHRAFGGFVGFQAGWLFCLARLSASASLMNAFARYVGALFPGGGARGAQAALVLVCALFVVGVNAAGIRQTSGATSFLAIAKVAPLLLIGLGGLFFIDPANLTTVPFGTGDFLRGVLLLIFAFTGFEILTVPAEESLRPRRDIPFALIATILTVCAIYVSVHTAAMGMLPGLASEKAPLATAAGVMAGPAGRYAMTAVAALSTAGCTLVSLVGGTRILYAMSATRQIPGWIGALHPATRTPVAASLLLGFLATALAIWGEYTWLAAVSAGTRLLVYLACCVACLRPAGAAAEHERPAAGERRSAAAAGPEGEGSEAAARAGWALPVATGGAIVVLLFALKPGDVIAGIIGVTVGMVLYLAARRARAAYVVGGDSR